MKNSINEKSINILLKEKFEQDKRHFAGFRDLEELESRQSSSQKVIRRRALTRISFALFTATFFIMVFFWFLIKHPFSIRYHQEITINFDKHYFADVAPSNDIIKVEIKAYAAKKVEIKNAGKMALIWIRK